MKQQRSPINRVKTAETGDRSSSKLKTKPYIEPLALQSPMPNAQKYKTQNYFNNGPSKPSTIIKKEEVTFLKSPRQQNSSNHAKLLSQSSSKLLEMTNESNRETNETLSIQLKLETQSRQVFQQQVKELKETLAERETELINLQQHMKQAQEQQSHKLSQEQERTVNMQQQEQVQLKKKYEQVINESEFLKDHLRIAQQVNKQLETEIKSLIASKQNSVQTYSTSQPKQSPRNSPERRYRSPAAQQRAQVLINHNHQLENQLQISLQNKQNIEKALEIKLAESLEREQFLTERIHRLEAQLRSKANFEKEKQEQIALEQKVKELNQTIENLKKQVKQHNSQIFQIKNQHQKQIESLQGQISELQNDKKLQEQESRRLLALNSSNEQKVNEITIVMNKQKEEYSNLLQQKIKHVSDLQTRNDLLNQKVQGLETQNINLQEQTKEQQRQLEKVEQNLDTWLSELQQKVEIINQLEKQLSDQKRLEQELQDLRQKTQEKLNELELQYQTMSIEKQGLQLQLKIAEQQNTMFNTSTWKQEFNLIKLQSDDIGNNLSKLQKEEIAENIFLMEEQNQTILEQLRVFETDMNSGLLSQIKQTNKYLLELNGLIMD